MTKQKMYLTRSTGFKNPLYKTIANGIFLAAFLHLEIYIQDEHNLATVKV
jgi:hypothetical protein